MLIEQLPRSLHSRRPADRKSTLHGKDIIICTNTSKWIQLTPSPWTGNNTQCLLSQFNNAMYVLGGDSSDFSVRPFPIPCLSYPRFPPIEI